MHFDIPSARIHVHSASAPWQPERPTLLCVHGVLCDHSVWQPLAAGIAQMGWNLAAIDLPGHSLSSGAAPQSVAEAASCIARLMDAMGLAQVALMGHSWGSLIALEAAAQLGARVSHLALVGTASPMSVAPALLELAHADPAQAIALIDKYSRSSATPADFDGQALGRQVLASNTQCNVLERGLRACNDYQGALAAMQRVSAPTLFVVGEYDRMTPAKAAQGLIAQAQARDSACTQVATLACGHQHMIDATSAMLQALQGLLQAHTAPSCVAASTPA